MKIVSGLEDLMWDNRIKSINQLSEETGITRRTLTQLRNNTAQGVQYETLERLCEYFGCGLDDLIYIDTE